MTSQDEVTGIDGRQYISDQATIWRWREAYQNDFAARMDWTIGANKTNSFLYGVTRSRLNFPAAYNPTGTVQWSAFGGNGPHGDRPGAHDRIGVLQR